MTAAFQLVYQAQSQGIVGGYHGEIDISLLIHPIADRFHVAIVHVHELRNLRDARVAFHGVNFVYLRRFCKRLNDGVFSAAVADNQNVHICSPFVFFIGRVLKTPHLLLYYSKTFTISIFPIIC